MHMVMPTRYFFRTFALTPFWAGYKNAWSVKRQVRSFTDLSSNGWSIRGVRLGRDASYTSASRLENGSWENNKKQKQKQKHCLDLSNLLPHPFELLFLYKLVETSDRWPRQRKRPSWAVTRWSESIPLWKCLWRKKVTRIQQQVDYLNHLSRYESGILEYSSALVWKWKLTLSFHYFDLRGVPYSVTSFKNGEQTGGKIQQAKNYRKYSI